MLDIEKVNEPYECPVCGNIGENKTCLDFYVVGFGTYKTGTCGGCSSEDIGKFIKKIEKRYANYEQNQP